VPAQDIGGPDAELRAAPAFDQVAHGNDDIEVVEANPAAYLPAALT